MKEKILKICKMVNSEIDYNSQGLIEKGVIDSFGFISLIALLEEEFMVELDLEQWGVECFNSVDTIVEMMKTQIKE